MPRSQGCRRLSANLRRRGGGHLRRPSPGSPDASAWCQACSGPSVRPSWSATACSRGGRRGRPPVEGVPVPRDPGLARLVVGARWDELEALIGPRLLEQVALDGIARAVADLLDPGSSVRDALQADERRSVRCRRRSDAPAPRCPRCPQDGQPQRGDRRPPGCRRTRRGPVVGPRPTGHRVGATTAPEARRAGHAPLHRRTGSRLPGWLRDLGRPRGQRARVARHRAGAARDRRTSTPRRTPRSGG